MAQVFHFRLPVDEVFEAHKPAPEAAAPASVANAPAAGSKAEADTGSSASRQAGNESDRKEKSSEGSTGDGVKLDLAEVSTSGATSVFAGRAAPGSSVTVFEGDVAVATAKANDNGDWSLATDHKFAGPDPKFSLRSGTFKIASETSAEDNSSHAKPAAALPSQTAVSDAAQRGTSPSVALLKNFENVVASAREEAAAQAQTGSAVTATATAPPPASQNSGAVPEVQALVSTPPEVASSEHPQSATIPVPMTFIFDEATLTSDGEKTAKLLLDYVQLKKFKSISLTGHADERGTAEYNMDLSRKRLDTVAAFLRNGGYDGELKLIPEGATQPFTGIDRSKFSRDDLMQLDRRVELRNAM
ncbi:MULTISPECIES: OmpA family protein [unclassified Hyphomicrobium]|uniref:OmpA family protein n=1 Tax=unclassified Hyphomicrobium TaxID=2619925 RepID=UPI0002EFAE82|nr:MULTISPECIES: OmpA family protein [unclassified Hyphomicrobium]